MSTIDCWGQPAVKTFPIMIADGRAGAPHLSSTPFRRKCTGKASFQGRIMNKTKLERFLASTTLSTFAFSMAAAKCLVL